MENIDELKKKYPNLDFRALDTEIDISQIEETPFFLREVRRRLIEKIKIFSSLLEDIINPDTVFVQMSEANNFKDKDQDQVMNIWKSLMIIQREALQIDLDSDEQKEADFLQTTLQTWQSFKSELHSIIEKLKDTWKNNKKGKIDIGYLG